MSKAEERALEKYPEHSVLIQPARRGGYYADNHLREGFIEGYHQAEKDLALTWEDVRKIVYIYENVLIDKKFSTSPIKDGYAEVLKRFLETKH